MRHSVTPMLRLGFSGHRRTARRYGIAIAFVLTAAVLRLVFLQTLETHASFVAFYPAVMLAAFSGGLRAGTLATILSAALAGFFGTEPDGSFVAVYPPDWLALAVFVIVSLLLSCILERLEQAQSRLHRAEVERYAELERMVAERTAELSASGSGSRDFIQSAMDAIIAIDDRQRIVLFNPAAEQMFGCRGQRSPGRFNRSFHSSAVPPGTPGLCTGVRGYRHNIPSKGLARIGVGAAPERRGVSHRGLNLPAVCRRGGAVHCDLARHKRTQTA